MFSRISFKSQPDQFQLSLGFSHGDRCVGSPPTLPPSKCFVAFAENGTPLASAGASLLPRGAYVSLHIPPHLCALHLLQRPLLYLLDPQSPYDRIYTCAYVCAHNSTCRRHKLAVEWTSHESEDAVLERVAAALEDPSLVEESVRVVLAPHAEATPAAARTLGVVAAARFFHRRGGSGGSEVRCCHSGHSSLPASGCVCVCACFEGSGL